MPRPIKIQEIKKDVPFKTLNTNTRDNARVDVHGKIEHTVPITHHYSLMHIQVDKKWQVV